MRSTVTTQDVKIPISKSFNTKDLQINSEQPIGISKKKLSITKQPISSLSKIQIIESDIISSFLIFSLLENEYAI